MGAVQQEAPGAVMGVVWTHLDWFRDGLCSGAGWQAASIVADAAGHQADSLAFAAYTGVGDGIAVAAGRPARKRARA